MDYWANSIIMFALFHCKKEEDNSSGDRSHFSDCGGGGWYRTRTRSPYQHSLSPQTSRVYVIVNGTVVGSSRMQSSFLQ